LRRIQRHREAAVPQTERGGASELKDRATVIEGRQMQEKKLGASKNGGGVLRFEPQKKKAEKTGVARQIAKKIMA